MAPSCDTSSRPSLIIRILAQPRRATQLSRFHLRRFTSSRPSQLFLFTPTREWPQTKLTGRGSRAPRTTASDWPPSRLRCLERFPFDLNREGYRGSLGRANQILFL